MKSLGRRWRGRKYSGTQLPVFLEANNLKPFISNDLYMVLIPEKFKTDRGLVSEGFKAEVLPKICEVYLKARDHKALKQQQIPIATRSDILMRGLAHIGIIALVDEATGYQYDRTRKALVMSATTAIENQKKISQLEQQLHTIDHNLRLIARSLEQR